MMRRGRGGDRKKVVSGGASIELQALRELHSSYRQRMGEYFSCVRYGLCY